MLQTTKYKLQTDERGISILLASLVVSLVLAIGLGIAAILITLLQISGIVQDSVRAFYAAESAVECKLFDLRVASTSCATFNLVNGGQAQVTHTIEGTTNVIKSFGTFKNARRGLEARF